MTLGAGEYAGRIIETFGQSIFAMRINTREGGPVDVYLMDESDFEMYSRGENISYHASLSEQSVRSTEMQSPIGAGDFALVVDNTPAFGAEPDGRAVVDLEVGMLSG